MLPALAVSESKSSSVDLSKKSQNDSAEHPMVVACPAVVKGKERKCCGSLAGQKMTK